MCLQFWLVGRGGAGPATPLSDLVGPLESVGWAPAGHSLALVSRAGGLHWVEAGLPASLATILQPGGQTRHGTPHQYTGIATPEIPTCGTA